MLGTLRSQEPVLLTKHLDCAFLQRTLIVKREQNRIEIVTSPGSLPPVEDVFTTGFTARRVAGLHPPLHDPRFSCGEMVREETACQTMAPKFNGHKITPQLQRVMMEMAESDFRECHHNDIRRSKTKF